MLVINGSTRTPSPGAPTAPTPLGQLPAKVPRRPALNIIMSGCFLEAWADAWGCPRKDQIMPRHQSAARRRARAAAREGTKYTAAFRRKDADREPPPRRPSVTPWNAWMGLFDAATNSQGLEKSLAFTLPKSPALSILPALAKSPAFTLPKTPALSILPALAKNPAFGMLSAFPHGTGTARRRDDGPPS